MIEPQQEPTMSTLLVLLFACASDPGAGKPAAKIENPPAQVSNRVAPTPPPGTPLTLDLPRSSVKAVGAKITGSHDISFSDYSGSITLDGEALKSLSITVQISSLKTDSEKLTNHLKSPDFFDIAIHPTATFTATSIKPGSEVAGMTHTITGDMTIRGTTKSVSFPAAVTVTPAEISAIAEFSINRQDFGVIYPGKPDDLIQDSVLLQVTLVAVRPPP
jgi:polyisoprenoid-binding protein YceI